MPVTTTFHRKAEMSDQILANARIVLADSILHGSLVIRDGQIAAIDSGTAVPNGAEDMAGDLLLPGLIELHTDNLERHIEPRPKVDWPHAAAIIAHDAELASVGITTVFDALRVGSLVSNGKPNYGEYARALADEILGLRAEGALRISRSRRAAVARRSPSPAVRRYGRRGWQCPSRSASCSRCCPRR